MKLTINRITLLFGLVIYLNFFVFDAIIPAILIALVFGACAFLGILNRKPNKAYTYGRGLLIGLRIFLLGIVYSLLFLIIMSALRIFKPLISPDGRNFIDSTRDSLVSMFRDFGNALPYLIGTSIFSLLLMLIIPIYFLRKSKLTDDTIDADLMDNQKK